MVFWFSCRGAGGLAMSGLWARDKIIRICDIPSRYPAYGPSSARARWCGAGSTMTWELPKEAPGDTSDRPGFGAVPLDMLLADGQLVVPWRNRCARIRGLPAHVTKDFKDATGPRGTRSRGHMPAVLGNCGICSQRRP
jgi:hypothetical protein